MTIASRDCSSPRIVQLHWSKPTGKVSRIIDGSILRNKRSAGNMPALLELNSAYLCAGVDCVVPERTDRFAVECVIATVRAMEVSMKMTAAHVVRRVNRLAAPRGPNAVCDPCPPKALARSADLPC